MSSERIDFISAYCDSWCDRCAFTERCSAFAARAAIAMCDGDISAGLELAVGSPPPEGSSAAAAATDGRPSTADADATELTGEETAEFEREIEERRVRVDASPLSPAARAYATLAHRWLQANAGPLARAGDPVIRDAVDIITWDHILIGAKLHRALHGRDEYQHGGRLGEEHPIQNDWNGSAKVALISLERSEAAWRIVASCAQGELPAIMADHLRQLRCDVEHEFPYARHFIRPGFDDDQLV